MWIIRLHKIEPRDYNFVERELKKCSFISRKISPIIFAKALILHKLQNKSWRRIAEELNTHHIYLFNFYGKYGKSEEVRNIFHKFVERRIILYIAEKGHITEDYLNNNEEVLLLTTTKLKTIIGG